MRTKRRTLINGCRALGLSSVFAALFLVMGVLLWTASPAEAKGKGKVKWNSSVQKGSKWEHSAARSKKAKDKTEEARKEAKEEAKEAKNKAKEETKEEGGKAKVKTKTLEDMKEIDKGSEKGQAMREQHRRKWWKFWDK